MILKRVWTTRHCGFAEKFIRLVDIDYQWPAGVRPTAHYNLSIDYHMDPSRRLILVINDLTGLIFENSGAREVGKWVFLKGSDERVNAILIVVYEIRFCLHFQIPGPGPLCRIFARALAASPKTPYAVWPLSVVIG